jgi:hypothetical protein
VQHPLAFAHNWIVWNENWEKLSRDFSIDQYRAALNQNRYPTERREAIFDRYILPILPWETTFIRASIGITLIALLSLPWLSGTRRLVVALSALSVILLIFSASFLSSADQRYLSTIHGSAALAGALAVTGLLQRWWPASRATGVNQEESNHSAD